MLYIPKCWCNKSCYQGSVAIVMSENKFYAVLSIAGKVSREMETNSFGGDVVEPMMIVNFNTLS